MAAVLHQSIRDTSDSSTLYKTNQLTALCHTCECLAATYDAHDTTYTERDTLGGCRLSTGYPDEDGQVGTNENLALLCGRMNLDAPSDDFVLDHPDMLLDEGNFGVQRMCELRGNNIGFRDEDTSTCMQNCTPEHNQCFHECWNDAAKRGKISHTPKVRTRQG